MIRTPGSVGALGGNPQSDPAHSRRDPRAAAVDVPPDAPAPGRGSGAHLVRGDVHIDVERVVSCPSVSLDDVVERLRFLDDTHPDLGEGVFVLPDTGCQQGIRHGHREGVGGDESADHRRDGCVLRDRLGKEAWEVFDPVDGLVKAAKPGLDLWVGADLVEGLRQWGLTQIPVRIVRRKFEESPGGTLKASIGKRLSVVLTRQISPAF